MYRMKNKYAKIFKKIKKKLNELATSMTEILIQMSETKRMQLL